MAQTMYTEQQIQEFRDGLIIIGSTRLSPLDFREYGNVNTMTYVTEPTRSLAGNIPDILTIETFDTPRLRINFDIMSLEIWRQLKKEFRAREVLCVYYDWEYDIVVSNKMYFAVQEDVDIFNQFPLSQEYYIITKKTVDIVGTNNQITDLSITYHPNGGLGTVAGQSVMPNELFYLSTGNTLSKAGYVLTHWNTRPDNSGVSYALGMATATIQSFTLYAIWESSTKRTLSFDYQGVYQQERDTNDANWITNKEVTIGQPVGTFPQPKFYLTENDMLVEVGTLIGWLNIPFDWRTNGGRYYEWLQEQIDNSTLGSIREYTSSTIYTVDGNTTIFAHWQPKNFTITFNSNGGSTVAPITAPYGNEITKPLPTRAGYTFSGWFKNSSLTDGFTVWRMVGKNIVLYAGWVAV